MQELQNSNPLLNDFESPVDFLILYTQTYNKQSKTPLKIHSFQIPYMSKFNILFLDHLFKYIEENTESPEKLINYFLNLDKTIFSIKNFEFYDKEFYINCGLIYIKSLVFLIDQCEYKLLNTDFSNSFLTYISILYYFCPLNLNFYSLFEYLINNCSDLIFLLNFFKKTFEKIEIKDEITCFKEDQRFLSRLNFNVKFLGPVRIKKYEFKVCLNYAVDLIVRKSEVLDVNEGYKKLIDFATELDLGGYLTEDVHERIVEEANKILIKEEKQ